ncbi:hypothetical protein Fot_09743 [Forsythia ovata]|uniref:Uncharacterized protein n=1 Tax=Forsythia ovata TaxID=205694 RepID=A0ABD1WHE8_9LAMI
MAVTSPSKRCKGGFPDTCSPGSSIQLKRIVKGGIETNVQRTKYVRTSVPITLRISGGVGPSSLSEKFSNGTSTMDIDGLRDICTNYARSFDQVAFEDYARLFDSFRTMQGLLIGMP